MTRCQHPIYQTWYNMIRRCTSEQNSYYHCYGGRGIRVCERWLNYANFQIDMYPTWFPGATIDRIDNDGDYTPENCQWLTRSENAKKAAQSRLDRGIKPKGWLPGKHQTEEAKEKISKAMIDKVHNISGKNGVPTGRIKKGYKTGKRNFVHIWINNGIHQTRIKQEDNIPLGYVRGRIFGDRLKVGQEPLKF